MWGGLVDQEGHPSSATDLQGKVVIADFVYTSCTDICPILSTRMRAIQDRLRQENLLDGRVQLLSFSVDPTRDTPEVLRAYAERFRADPAAWRFLTGPEDEVLPVLIGGFRLGVTLVPDHIASAGEVEDGPYSVMHSERFVLIDRDWRIRTYYDSYEVDPGRVTADVRQLLSQS
jgi:protein SCO1/2